MQNHLTPVLLFNHVPVEAGSIHTPLISAAWRQYLKEHLHQNLVQYFLQSISLGFREGFDGSGTQSAQKNLQSAVDHPTVVDNYLQNELSLGRMSGPYPPSSCPGVHLNRFGVILKNHQQDKWQLITDLSYPSGSSVNDGIPSQLCSLTYITIDDAIFNILRLGKNTKLAKIDIKSAFRLLPVHPADRYLLGVRWRGNVYIDHCIPFGPKTV